MKNNLNKYRNQQEAGETISTRTRNYKNALLVDVNVDEEIELNPNADDDDKLFDDNVSISNQAAELLAQEAVEEDLEIEMKNSQKTAAKEQLIEKTTTFAKATQVKARTPLVATMINEEGKVKEVLGTRDQIIVNFAPLIKYIAQKIAARLPANIELDDLISAGVIGLMDAIDKYDASRDNKFKTYAEFRVRGAILDELRAQDWVPRSVREKAKMLERAYARIEQLKGSPANDEEICKELNISQEEYHELLSEVRSVSLLSFEDIGTMSKGDKSNIEFSENAKAPTPFAEVNSAHVKKLVAEAINELPEKQRLVLSLYYYEDLNLKEIGKVLEVTESRVSQLHTQAIMRLKARLKGHVEEIAHIFA